MPVNQYDKFSGQRYVSTYVPLPFQELAGLGDQIQKTTTAKEAEMSQLEKMISDVKVANQVLSEGSGEDPGLDYRNTGYGDYQNKLLDKVRTAHQQISEEYLAGNLSLQQLAQKTNAFNNQFKQDFQKLKIAEANSVNIFKQDEEYRKNAEVGQKRHLANQLGEEGARLIANPFGVDYKGAPINKGIDEIETLNKFAGQFQDKILKNSTSWKDSYGKIHYKSTTGVGEEDIRTAVSAAFEQDNVGHDYRERVTRQLRDNGRSWDEKIEIDSPTYNKKGEKIGTEKKQVSLGDYLYNHDKEQFTQGVIAKARKENPDEKIMSDDFEDWKKKRGIEEEDARKRLNWTSATTPSDPNNPTNTYEGMNANLKNYSASKGGNIGNNFAFDNEGNFKLITKDSKEGVEINGKIYTPDKLPAGYNYRLNDNLTKVLTKDGKDVKIFTAGKGSDEEQRVAISELLKVGKRLGIEYDDGDKSGNALTNLQNKVGDYFKKAYQLEMNYTRMDQGTIDTISQNFNTEQHFDKDGNIVITNPGSLSYSEIKDANGNLVDPNTKSAILNNARLLGPTFSLTNDNIKAGDINIQSTDGKRYIINTGLKNINDALSEQTRATKNIHNYIMTGQKSVYFDTTNGTEENKAFATKNIKNIKAALPNSSKNIIDNAVDMVTEKGITYIYYIKNSALDNMKYKSYEMPKGHRGTTDESIEMGVMKVDPQYADPVRLMSIDDANTEISKERMLDLLPSQNSKNFDRETNIKNKD